MSKTKTTTTTQDDDMDDAPKLTRAWMAKAKTLTPPTDIGPVVAIEKEVRGGVVHATVRRGGARPGAGRKPLVKPSEKFSITLPHDLAGWVHTAARKSRMKEPAFLAKLVASHAG